MSDVEQSAREGSGADDDGDDDSGGEQKSQSDQNEKSAKADGKNGSKGGDKKSGDQKSDDDKDDDKEEKPHSRLPLIIAIIVVVIALIGALIYWLLTRNEISTDDAYTDGRAVSVASNISGYVTELDVTDNERVKAGQLLLVIDPRDNNAALQQQQANLLMAQSQLASAQIDLQQTKVKAPAQLQEAQAQLAQAEAQLVQTRLQYRRQHNVDQRATAATDVDQATEQLRSAAAMVSQERAQVAAASLVPQMIASAEQTVVQRAAQLQQARANLASAKVKLTYSYITAPQDGTITMRNAELGTYVQAGTQLFYIVTPQIWVTANFKETQLARMRIGDRVSMTVDAIPDMVLHGYVQSFEDGSGARFTTFPSENATGNFVKIVRRVPVKILIDHGLPAQFYGLPLGISVEPTVTVK